MSLGIEARQNQVNLLGRPAMQQQIAHHLEQDGIGVQFTHRTALAAALLTALLRRRAAVLAGRGIAAQFTADRAGRTPHNAGDLAHAVVLLLEAGHCHSVFGLKLAVGSWL